MFKNVIRENKLNYMWFKKPTDFSRYYNRILVENRISWGYM